ncbi:type II secretion system protein [Pseudoalteromonas spongiae]|uniref:type II secretion system protein n=1 Tax=Pseudoalteromonas spongiae TaxID=298657 RepID=UPI00026CDAA4|nr:type II secretion system protein [Pseudoalteromonas spongiae]ATC97617.1 hypothetical protein PSPO_a0394 [Pseudoalteromonas spongiae UST010723-006]
MWHFSLHKGFSLIELMVVMAIVATLLALTGGLVVKNVDQQERLVETQKVRQVFKSLSYQAYYRGQPITIHALDKQLKILSNDSTKVINFEQLSFVKQNYQVSTTAIITPNNVLLEGARGNILLTSLFETFNTDEMR